MAVSGRKRRGDGDRGFGLCTVKRESGRSFFEIFKKTFAKPLDNSFKIVYNLYRCRHGNMREWRNWQTRTFEGRVVYTVRVQVPFLAPMLHRVKSVQLHKRAWRNWQTR